MSSQAETIARASDTEIQESWRTRCGSTPDARGTDGALPAFAPDAAITATEVMVTVTAMLKAVNLQVFELGMWQAWSGR